MYIMKKKSKIISYSIILLFIILILGKKYKIMYLEEAGYFIGYYIGKFFHFIKSI